MYVDEIHLAVIAHIFYNRVLDIYNPLNLHRPHDWHGDASPSRSNDAVYIYMVHSSPER